MGRIVIADGLQRRTVPTTDVAGDLTIRVDLSGEKRTVVLPEDVRVERDSEGGTGADPDRTGTER